MAVVRAFETEEETSGAPSLTFEQLRATMDELVRSKGWYAPDSARPQTPRNLASSVALEAAELLECFQWADSADTARVEDELADVILYVVQLANVLGSDLEAVVLAKLARNHLRTWDAPPVDVGGAESG